MAWTIREVESGKAKRFDTRKSENGEADAGIEALKFYNLVDRPSASELR
jgi:hypothetical protein